MTYEEQRAQLVAQAQEHIDNGNIEESKKIMNTIRELDAKHEEQITAQANLDALNGTRPNRMRICTTHWNTAKRL